jgi:hypothetical protein
LFVITNRRAVKQSGAAVIVSSHGAKIENIFELITLPGKPK